MSDDDLLDIPEFLRNQPNPENEHGVSASFSDDVLCDAKKLLTRWTGGLDAPTEELRMIERLIKVVDNLSDALNKAANEMLITPTCTKGGREALKSLTGQASADT